jgi:hypothetical protein
MAPITGATTTTSLTELIYAEWISPVIQAYASNYKNPSQFLARWDPQNGSSTVSVPRWVSDEGTPPDDGVGVDTEYNAIEATDLVANELETTDSTFSVAEYGLLREPTDTVIEDAQSAASLIAYIAGNGMDLLMAAANDDACALAASLTSTSGQTGVNLGVVDVDDALYDMADRGVLGELVGIFDTQAARDFQDALQATGSSQAVYPQSADRQMATSFDPKQGRNVSGFTLTYKGVDIYHQGLMDTLNTGADVYSMIFVRGDIEAQRETACLGQASRRDFRIATQRDESARCTEVVMTMRWGCGVTNNTMGQGLFSDA